MAANTPLRRYKQNTHGGGIRDPLVISWPNGLAARGALRHQFCHACDLVPTLLDVVGVKPPATINGVAQMPIEGTSFADSLRDANAPAKATPQYFEMFGHRGLVQAAGRPWLSIRGQRFRQDKWELFHLDRDFSETDDLADKEPERLKAMIDGWWRQAEAHQVLPLDDRFAAALRRQRQALPRPAQAVRVPCRHGPCADRRGARRAQPRLHDRGRCADRRRTEGVLIAHGDMTCGYSLLHQGQPAYLRHEYRRRASFAVSDRRCRPATAGSACACAATRARTSPRS
jgi:arylsulfatase